MSSVEMVIGVVSGIGKPCSNSGLSIVFTFALMLLGKL